jgi:hypothetical protein
MISRALFVCLAAFWILMNVLLWRSEYGVRHGGIAVPVDLVWQKIMTAPDASALTIYQNGRRTGFCEFSTSVQQEMAKLDEASPPPEGFMAHAGYQVRLNGNVSLGDFTNHVRFDGRLEFSPARQWRELNLKASLHALAVEIRSLATNQTVHLKVSSDAITTLERDFKFADLQNPSALLRIVAGNSGDGLLGALDLPALAPDSTSAAAASLHWEARRDYLKVGREPVAVYRLEARLLQNSVVIYVSKLGEILRVELPGGIIATLDEWGKP